MKNDTNTQFKADSNQVVLESLNIEIAHKALCAKALTLTGSLTEAAKLLGISRAALRRRMSWYGLKLKTVVETNSKK